MKALVQSIYAKVWGQCSEALQNMVKYLAKYEENEKNKNVKWLLEEVKKIMTGIDKLGNRHITYLSALKSFVNMHQGQNESDDSLLKCAKSMVETLSLAGGEHIFYSPQLCEETSPNYPTNDKKKVKMDKFCAVHLLSAANPHRYKELNEELINASYVGCDEYLTTPSSAYELLVWRSGRFQSISKSSDKSHVCQDGNQRHHTSIGFLHTDFCAPVNELVLGCDGTTIDLKCYYCHARRHTSNNCPKLPAKRIHNPRNGGRGSGGGRGANMIQFHVGFQQSADAALIPDSWVSLIHVPHLVFLTTRTMSVISETVHHMNVSRCFQTAAPPTMIRWLL
jgi:hypothetical protein